MMVINGAGSKTMKVRLSIKRVIVLMAVIVNMPGNDPISSGAFRMIVSY